MVFEISGFGDVEEAATVPLGGEVGVNAVMAPGGVTETVQVVGVVPPEIQTTETASNLASDEVNALPIGRTPFAIAATQPGLNTNTPNAGQLAINGAFAYDNVYLVDGVDTNDNLFGTSNALYVADAIEETQVLTSGSPPSTAASPAVSSTSSRRAAATASRAVGARTTTSRRGKG